VAVSVSSAAALNPKAPLAAQALARTQFRSCKPAAWSGPSQLHWVKLQWLRTQRSLRDLPQKPRRRPLPFVEAPSGAVWRGPWVGDSVPVLGRLSGHAGVSGRRREGDVRARGLSSRWWRRAPLEQPPPPLRPAWGQGCG